MKRLLLNSEERKYIRLNTFIGAQLKLRLAVLSFNRHVYREYGYFTMKKAKKQILKLINHTLSGRK